MVVIFRTNAVGVYREQGIWIAIDGNKDGILEGYGYSGYSSYQPLEENIIGYTMENYPIYIRPSYDPAVRLYIFDGRYGLIFESTDPDAALAETSPSPVEPYASNGQEIYSPEGFGTVIDFISDKDIAHAEDIITLSFNLRNDGTTTDDLFARIIDIDTRTEIYIMQSLNVAIGQSILHSVPVTMPNKNWNLRLEAGHGVFDSAILEPHPLKDVFIDYPINMNPDNPWVLLTPSEREEIHNRHIVHSQWLDRNNLVNWKLDESILSRSMIFDSLGDYFETEPYTEDFMVVVNDDPYWVYTYSNEFIRPTQKETIYAILSDLRKDFAHVVSDNPEEKPGQPYTVPEALTTYVNGKRISRQGCHSMSRIIVAMVRNLNIPAYETRTEGMPNHSAVVFPSINKILWHGDEIYYYIYPDKSIDEILRDYTT